MTIINYFKSDDLKDYPIYEFMGCILYNMYKNPPSDKTTIIARDSLPIEVFANCVYTISRELIDSNFPDYLIDKLWNGIYPRDIFDDDIDYTSISPSYVRYDYHCNYCSEVPVIFGGVYFFISILEPSKDRCLNLIKDKVVDETGSDYVYFKAFEEKVTEYRNIISKDAQVQKEEEAIFADEAETNALKEKITQLETLNIDLTKREVGYIKQIDFLNEDFRQKIEATSEKESKYKVEIDELKKQIDQLNSDINAQTPNKYKLTEGKKTDFIKIISAMYDLRLFSTTDGRIANNKQKLFDELGKFFNENFKDYSKALSQAKQQNNFMNVFDDLKTKADDYYKKESKINK